MLTILLLTLLLAPAAATARTITVETSGPITTLHTAAQSARPGDTILFLPGIYPGGDYVAELRGTAESWITIRASPKGEVILRGGGNAWHLVDPAWLRIEGFIMEGQTGNGMNIDDAGSFETPAHHIAIQRCRWRGIAAEGNNDQLKLSGVDSFLIRECTFTDGSPGGSMIDMVGCHGGTIAENRFERAGSNAIQAKGGSRWILVSRNEFLDGGARAINIGGSTDTAFFRPRGALYECADMQIFANLFVASDAPLAFVGALRCEAINNTMIAPRRWALRILQETTLPGFVECGENTLRNNIFIVGANVAGYTVNIGPNTRPETFVLSNNLWYCPENPTWAGPSLPVEEVDGIVGMDPLLAGAPGDVTPLSGSPAIGAGAAVARPAIDLYGRPFASPRSVGAAEGAAPSLIARQVERSHDLVRVSAEGRVLVLRRQEELIGDCEVSLVSLTGRVILQRTWSKNEAGSLVIGDEAIPPGLVIVMIRCQGRVFSQALVVTS